MTAIFWGLIGASLLIIDAITSAFLLLGFGIAGLVTMACAKFLPLYAEILIFAISGTLMSLYIVPKVRKVPKTKNFEESLVDTEFLATQDMEANEKYQEKIKGTYWNIMCEHKVSVGDKLKVVKVDSKYNLLIVKGEN